MTTAPIPSITDEQIAEIEQSVHKDLENIWAFGEYQGSIVLALVGVIARLRAAERDAERIEWLASQCKMQYGHREHAQYNADFEIFFQSDRDQCRPCDFRAAIDAAMRGELE